VADDLPLNGERKGYADHTMRGFPTGVDGYAGSLACAREVSAVIAACMRMRKSLFHEIAVSTNIFSPRVRATF
jgi:hypothetical protein